MVLKEGSQIIYNTSLAETKVKSSTSPSLFLGTKVDGSSKSKTDSVLGKRPLSDSKKHLGKWKDAT